MPQHIAPVILEWHVDAAPGAELAQVTLCDNSTGHRFRFEVPVYAFPSLRDFAAECAVKLGDRYPTTTLRVDD